MDLDLTCLNRLALRKTQVDATASRKPSESYTDDSGINTPTEPKNVSETNTEGSSGILKLQLEADRKKQEIEWSEALYKEYQQHIQTSAQLQTEIQKGIRSGVDIYSLFLKACKVISCMTDNDAFYSQVEEDVKAIYGQGLLEPIPLQIDLQQTRERLTKLREAEERAQDEDSRERIRRAVQAHENKVALLQHVIESREQGREKS